MKRIIVILLVCSMIPLGLGINMQAFAQVEEIESVKAAKELAADAGGSYVEGSAAPVLKEGELALPIVQEESGNILGYVVADKEKLIAALNKAGLTEVANSIAALEAGGSAGSSVSSGIAFGTATKVALAIAVIGGVALAVGGGGGGGGSSSSTATSHH